MQADRRVHTFCSSLVLSKDKTSQNRVHTMFALRSDDFKDGNRPVPSSNIHDRRYMNPLDFYRDVLAYRNGTMHKVPRHLTYDGAVRPRCPDVGGRMARTPDDVT